jgi:ABC-type glutathione transport system ATPase component
MDSQERLAEAAWIHKLGPEAETLFTKGSEPFVRSAVVDPIVSLLRAGQSVALVGPAGVGKRSLALSLRRSEAWSDEAQATLSFDVPMGIRSRGRCTARPHGTGSPGRSTWAISRTAST